MSNDSAAPPPSPPGAAKEERVKRFWVGDTGRAVDLVLYPNPSPDGKDRYILAEWTGWDTSYLSLNQFAQILGAPLHDVPPTPPPATECLWTVQSERNEVYRTSCGAVFDLNQMRIVESGRYNHCPKCGAKIGNGGVGPVVPPPASADARGMVEALIQCCGVMEDQGIDCGAEIVSGPHGPEARYNLKSGWSIPLRDAQYILDRDKAKAALLALFAASEAAREKAERDGDHLLEDNASLASKLREAESQVTAERQRRTQDVDWVVENLHEYERADGSYNMDRFWADFEKRGPNAG